jgi:hypothetical protein
MDYTIKRYSTFVKKIISDVYFNTSLQDYEVHMLMGR